MKRTSRLILSFSLTLGIASAAQSTILLDTFAGAPPGYQPGFAGFAVTTVQFMDRPFSVAGNYNLTTIDVVLSLNSGSNSIFNVQLRSDAAGVPGTVIETFAVTVPAHSFNSLFSVNSGLSPMLTTGTYHLVVSTTDPGAAGGWGFSNDNHNAPLLYSTNQGSTWSSFNNTDMATRIQGTPVVPEPATVAALGIGAFALIRRRRSRKWVCR